MARGVLGRPVWLVVAAALATGVAACDATGSRDGGSSIPASAVARVDGSLISKASFDHWYAIITKTAAPQSRAAVAPDPPAFRKCIAALRGQLSSQRQAQLRSLPRSVPAQTRQALQQRPAPTNAQLKAECAQRRAALAGPPAGLRQLTMSELIRARWVELQAKALHLSLSPRELTQAVARQSAGASRGLLRRLGMTAEDLRFRLRSSLLMSKITAKAGGGSRQVSDAQVSSYYKQHKALWATPERRQLQVIVSPTQARAAAAKSALAHGTSWKTAADSYATSKTVTVTEVAKAAQVGSSPRAPGVQIAFSAPPGKVLGPVRAGPTRWYVLQVTRVTPAVPASLSRSKARIQQILGAAHSARKLTAFETGFVKRWRAKTTCRRGYLGPLCSNAAKPSARGHT